MSTIRTNAILDAAGGNTATINGITPVLASQAQAEAGAINTALMTPLRVAEAIAAKTGKFSNFQLFTASGSWVVPAGVTEAFVIVCGGGSGGGNSSTSRGQDGGLAADVLTVSGTITVTVGAGGAGNNGGGGGAGGSSTFSTLSATGGVSSTQTPGVGSGTGVLSNMSDFESALGMIMPNAIKTSAIQAFRQIYSRPNATSSTAALEYSLAGDFVPGAGGSYETGTSGGNSDATGGVGGAVFVFW